MVSLNSSHRGRDGEAPVAAAEAESHRECQSVSFSNCISINFRLVDLKLGSKRVHGGRRGDDDDSEQVKAHNAFD